MDECALEKFMGVVVVQVVYYAVTKLCGKYFALLGTFYDEYRRGFRLIGARQQIVSELFDVLMQLSLEVLHIRLAALMFLCTLKCCMKVEDKCLARQSVCHTILAWVFIVIISRIPDIVQVLDCSNREAVEPVVVVRGIDTTRIEVQVVAVGLRVQRGRPVVAVRAPVVQASPVPVARGWEKDAPTKPHVIGYHLQRPS
jgi:hypothetical protein